MNDRIDQRLPWKTEPCQSKGRKNRKRQAADDTHDSDTKTQCKNTELIGSQTKHGLLSQPETVLAPDRTRRRGAQIFEQGLGRRRLAGRQQRRWIDNGRMGVGPKREWKHNTPSF